MRKYAFLVGINKYKYLDNLSTPLNDVKAIGQVLKDDFSYVIHIGSDKPTTKEKGAISLQDLKQYFSNDLLNQFAHQTEDIQVFIYFAGHGIAENSETGIKGYLVPSDGRPGDRTSWYPMEELLSALEKLGVKHLLLVLDCCFGGAIRWASKYRDINFVSEKAISLQHYKYFTENPSWQVLTSTAPNQSALDFISHGEVINHSPFASLFLKGLSGEADTTPDKVITTAELFNYLQLRLPAITSDQGHTQNVSLFPLDKHQNGEFLFFLNGFDPKKLSPIDFQNPYKGLTTYGAGDQQLFFGRNKAIKALSTKINSHPLTVVVGASGTGKSSLVQAGIVPHLSGKVSVIQPGRKPLLALESLGEFDYLVIDQYEQLITQAENNQIAAFWKKLIGYLSNHKRLIITIRIDFEKQLDIPPELFNQWEEGRFIIPPFSAEELREIIITPALRVGRFIEPLSLVDQIIDEVIPYPGSLPLLSFTMQQLFEQCAENLYRNITRQNYLALGGVTGALQTIANKVYDSFSKEEQGAMRSLMLRMVSITGGETAGKRVMEKELIFGKEDNREIGKVIKALLNERLIRGGKDLENMNYLEPSHDALVRTWKKMQDWIKDFSEDRIFLHARLEDAIKVYEESEKKRKYLWYNSPNRTQITEAQNIENKIPLVLNKQEVDFMTKSRRLFTQIWMSVAAAILLVILGLSGLTMYAQQQQTIAEQRQVEAENNLLQFQTAERLRINQRLKPLLGEAEIFENAEEFELALARYDTVNKRLDSIDNLTKVILMRIKEDNFIPDVARDSIERLKKSTIAQRNALKK